MIEPTIVLDLRVIGIRESPLMGIVGHKTGTLIHIDAISYTR